MRSSNNILVVAVVGDRRLLRFLRGKSYRMDDSVKAYKDFLKWRDDNDIDKIRQDIVYGGKDSAFKFPFGELALSVAPQIILSANAQDKKGRLLGKLDRRAPTLHTVTLLQLVRIFFQQWRRLTSRQKSYLSRSN